MQTYIVYAWMFLSEILYDYCVLNCRFDHKAVMGGVFIQKWGGLNIGVEQSKVSYRSRRGKRKWGLVVPKGERN